MSTIEFLYLSQEEVISVRSRVTAFLGASGDQWEHPKRWKVLPVPQSK